MDVAEPLNVSEDLVGAGPGNRTGRGKGVAVDEACAAIARADGEIGGADFDLTRNRELAGNLRQPQQRCAHGFHRGDAELAQPDIAGRDR